MAKKKSKKCLRCQQIIFNRLKNAKYCKPCARHTRLEKEKEWNKRKTEEQKMIIYENI